MIIESIRFRGHPCFKEHWSGFETIRPINVIIGRNNAGKTHLLDLVEQMTGESFRTSKWQLYCSGVLDEATLKDVFRPDVSGGEIGGTHWSDHGEFLVDTPVKWVVDVGGIVRPSEVEISGAQLRSRGHFRSEVREQVGAARLNYIVECLRDAKTRLGGKVFKRITAERDICVATTNTDMKLLPNGEGATNIIRRYILSSAPEVSSDLVKVDLLTALNEIFATDGKFTEIQVKLHDQVGTVPQLNRKAGDECWEIYLGEAGKGLVPLSRSGSGLKTVILVLLQLLIIPRMERRNKDNYVFAFEELENNLHPALLRRLFSYIEKYVKNEEATVFLTTHSSTALDYFGTSSDAQIVHVTHDGMSARTTTVSAHFDKLGVISELGAKPSDLLQANGIIWVEGPSDCIYLNRWIDIFSNGALKEGRDYQCAFYAGTLLARTQFSSPEDAEADLVNLFRINPNIVVICDSDKTAEGKRVKDRVRRISSEVRKIPGAHIWITKTKEIENYLPAEAINKIRNLMNSALARSEGGLQVEAVGRYESFFPAKSGSQESYWERVFSRKSYDKVDLAASICPHLTEVNLSNRFGLEADIREIIEKIETWNK